MNKREQAKKEMYARIERHGEQLKAIFNLPADTDPIKLCKSLRRIENKAERYATDYCNGVIDIAEMETSHDKILKAVDKILKPKQTGVPIFFNQDPRGYALKIDDEYIRNNNIRIMTDWGGYGIIAPDLTTN